MNKEEGNVVGRGAMRRQNFWEGNPVFVCITDSVNFVDYVYVATTGLIIN